MNIRASVLLQYLSAIFLILFPLVLYLSGERALETYVLFLGYDLIILLISSFIAGRYQ